MAQEYLPAPSNVRLADLMKEHNISQPELAKEIGCSKSTISRFISGAKGTLTHEQVLKIARLFKVSTDFLLGETNIPDRKNYDIAELGLSVEAAKNLYTGRVNTEVVNLLLENARFAELTYRIAQYFDDTFASGIAAQNAMLTTLSTLLRTKVKTPEAAKAAKDISLRRKPVYQGDLDDIEMYFMSGNVLHNSMWTAAGAITSSIALSETFNALSQGVVEMQENPYDMIYDNSFYEVQKYVNQTDHVYSTIFNLISVDIWNGLSEDQQNIITETSNELQDWTNEYYFAHKDEYLDKLKEAGMQVNEDVDRDDIKNAMMPAIEEFLKSQPGDLWTTYQAIYDLSNS